MIIDKKKRWVCMIVRANLYYHYKVKKNKGNI